MPAVGGFLSALRSCLSLSLTQSLSLRDSERGPEDVFLCERFCKFYFQIAEFIAREVHFLPQNNDYFREILRKNVVSEVP